MSEVSKPSSGLRAFLTRRVDFPMWALLLWCVLILIITLPVVLAGPPR